MRAIETSSGTIYKDENGETGEMRLIARALHSYVEPNYRYVQVNYRDDDTDKQKAEKRLKKAMCPLDKEDLNFLDSKYCKAYIDLTSNFEYEKFKAQTLKNVAEYNKKYYEKLREIKEFYSNPLNNTCG